MNRRALLTLLAGGVAAACSPSTERPSGRHRSGTPHEDNRMELVEYGTDDQQMAELTRPTGVSKGVVVVIHGGFWLAQYDLSLGRPLAASLVANGWAAYNIEYRRVGNGGGWPATFDDVSAAIDALADLDDVDVTRVITLGHSAGGHLAVLAASRPSPAVAVTAAISQAGVLDLTAAMRDNLGDGAVQRFMADAGDDGYAAADPTVRLPLTVPVRCIHGRNDQTVPPSQSGDYVDRARGAGADAELIEVDGDHFAVIDPRSPAWTATLEVLETL